MMFRRSHNLRRFCLPRSGLNLGFSLVCLAFADNSHAITAGTYEISAEHSGKCVDVSGPSLDNGAKVHQWSCHGGTNQQWRVTSTDGAYRLQAVHSGKCLDVTEWSTQNGTGLQQWSCGRTQHG